MNFALFLCFVTKKKNRGTCDLRVPLYSRKHCFPEVGGRSVVSLHSEGVCLYLAAKLLLLVVAPCQREGRALRGRGAKCPPVPTTPSLGY